MSRIKLGSSSLETAPIAFGGNVFGWTIDEPTSFSLLDAFVGEGFNVIDTSNTYGPRGGERTPGVSETIIGRWLKKSGKRDQVVIATKAGRDFSPEIKGLSKKALFEAVEGSLKRLGVDRIDLYQAHTDDLETPVEETLAAFDELVRQGKVKAIGASNFTADRLATSLGLSRRNGYAAYQTIQPGYNLYDRQKFEGALESVVRANGLTVLAHSALGRGFLTGKYRSETDLEKSPRGSSVKRFLDERGLKILNALDYVGKSLDAAPAQVALAWLIAKKVVPIASATNLKQLDELLASVHLDLNEEALAYLDRASAYEKAGLETVPAAAK